MNSYVWARNALIRFVYTRLVKPILFKFDPENVHDFFLRVGRFLGRFALTRWKTRMLFSFRDKSLSSDILGLHFVNPIGLAAGFDKDGVMTDILPDVGFGFAEIGSVTARPYAGNTRPRLWRLPKTRSLGVWYGLKNEGAKVLAGRLFGRSRRIPLGVSVGFSNCQENNDIDKAIADYIEGFSAVEPVADYITVNISCPNTAGGMPFIDMDNYARLLDALENVPTTKPVMVKISPEMSPEDVGRLLNISASHRVHGFVCSNLVKKYSAEDILDPVPPHGGLSGKVVFQKALDLLSRMYAAEPERFVYVFCGGVFSADDAYAAIRRGASLIQLITGMIFEGPQVIGEIDRGLAERFRRDGLASISEAVGIDNLRK